MFTTLPQSCIQGFLLLTDLPVTVNVSDINYLLICNENCSGLLNGVPPIIADFPCVTSL